MQIIIYLCACNVFYLFSSLCLWTELVSKLSSSRGPSLEAVTFPLVGEVVQVVIRPVVGPRGALGRILPSAAVPHARMVVGSFVVSSVTILEEVIQRATVTEIYLNGQSR